MISRIPPHAMSEKESNDVFWIKYMCNLKRDFLYLLRFNQTYSNIIYFFFLKKACLWVMTFNWPKVSINLYFQAVNHIIQLWNFPYLNLTKTKKYTCWIDTCYWLLFSNAWWVYSFLSWANKCSEKVKCPITKKLKKRKPRCCLATIC